MSTGIYTYHWIRITHYEAIIDIGRFQRDEWDARFSLPSPLLTSYLPLLG